MNDDCVFCKIANGSIPATVVARDGDVVAIEDLNPQAPVHLLVVPAAHHRDVAAMTAGGDAALTQRVVALAARLGRERGGESGFRLVVNTGPDGGQTVDHLHVHVLAGRAMGWPPG